MRLIIKILISLFALFNLKGFAQNVQLKSQFEKIEVQEDSTFTNEITLVFKKSNETRYYPIFYDTELEQISNIKLFVQKGKRLKEQPIKNIFEDDVELDILTSKKVKSVEIPPDLDVILKYSVTCSELMYFSKLHFFSYNEIDTIKYQVNIPEKFELVHNTINKDLLSFFSIDSSKTETNSIWDIKVSPTKVEPDPLQFFGIYKNMKVPLMRTLVLPDSYKNEPVKYMNDWYYNNVSLKKGLNISAKQKMDELTTNVSDPLQIVNIIYSYVKRNFKYVAIEIGMGAFIPSHVNEVYLNKQGDCKDLSNFLSEALNYKGIDCDIALAATFDHISDCDFPSLSSANHVICIAYINGETVLLDPTDPIHFEETPVQSLQDRTILIVNSEGGSFIDALRFNPQQNEISYEMNLKVDSDKKLIEGNFDINYNGISSNFLQRQLKSISQVEFDNFVKLLYEEIFGNQTVSDLKVSNDLEKLHFNGNITINGKTFDDEQSKYLFIDFLPRLIEFESRETLIEGTYLRNPFYKKARIKIELDQPVEAFKPITYEHQGDGVSLKVNITPISNQEIECNYDFIFNHIFIEKENINTTNEILKSFNKIINDPIVLKKQNN